MGKTGDHIASINHTEMYRGVFDNDPEKAKSFIDAVKKKAAKDPDAHRAKLILHETSRMVWLADRIDRKDIAYYRPAFQVLFYVISAEAVAKRFDDFREEGFSAAYVQKFFKEHCTGGARAMLGKAFSLGRTTGFVKWENVVDLLYDIRCRLAHEGRYSSLMLPEKSGKPVLCVDWGTVEDKGLPPQPPKPSSKKGKGKLKPKWKAPDQMYAHITVKELRRIILEGAVEAAKKLVPAVA